MKTPATRHLPVIALLVLMALSLVLLSAYLDVPPKPIAGARVAEAVAPFSTAQEKALGVALEANKLAVSLALLVFTGVGLLINAKSGFVLETLAQKLTLVLVLLACCLSLYAGYVLYDNLIEMLDSEYLNLASTVVLRARDLQIYTLLTAVVVLGCLFLTSLESRRPPKE
jgi:hypothetical protein